mmetsp:Transcript_32966/g.92583  ORF Transcript_32966/g.92583 Transcript_32966/m.92583 type:complete len:281 (+) Transcript_32966:950-1792(+)
MEPGYEHRGPSRRHDTWMPLRGHLLLRQDVPPDARRQAPGPGHPSGCRHVQREHQRAAPAGRGGRLRPPRGRRRAGGRAGVRRARAPDGQEEPLEGRGRPVRRGPQGLRADPSGRRGFRMRDPPRAGQLLVPAGEPEGAARRRQPHPRVQRQGRAGEGVEDDRGGGAGGGGGGCEGARQKGGEVHPLQRRRAEVPEVRRGHGAVRVLLEAGVAGQLLLQVPLHVLLRPQLPAHPLEGAQAGVPGLRRVRRAQLRAPAATAGCARSSRRPPPERRGAARGT